MSRKDKREKKKERVGAKDRTTGRRKSKRIRKLSEREQDNC